MSSFDRLLQKIENAKDLDFSSIFDSVTELFKKVWLKGFVMILILMVFAIGINLLFTLIGLTPNSNPFLNGFDLESYSEFYSSNVIYNIPQTILVSTITMTMVAGFYRICKQVILGENVTDEYFYFLKKEYFSKLLMLGIIHTAIATVAQLMFFIPYIYVFVPLAYFTIIFANNPHLTEGEIVKASFKLGNKKWLISFGTMFVAGILGMLGVIACFVGLLFTISIVYLPVFFIYNEVVGFDDTSEIEQIGVRDESDY
ncbi:hypothetical protein MBM09_15085 [Flaviramulus sp. BrNp1-15]|uniref:hypothetical protein n=1 Tax=Flaviramulus sp. BrNp1-15 TaxID=2916754 RepID=UPI001EE7C707|nr:hypothetical protein [Flaviramulus sp. BrNp1-15]ULC59217.1 hypothetical protein MBM09_15085 [Flaviramulus sp. BrNp1-15]